MGSDDFGPECTFCGDATGECPHVLLEVDLWDCEVRGGPLAEAMEARWATLDDGADEEADRLDLFERCLEPASQVADAEVEQEEDTMPGMSWTIRRYLVKHDLAAAVARAVVLLTGAGKRTPAGRAAPGKRAGTGRGTRGAATKLKKVVARKRSASGPVKRAKKSATKRR